jgi:hypothetical protein
MINRANGRFQEEQYYPSRGAHLDIRPRGSRNGARGDARATINSIDVNGVGPVIGTVTFKDTNYGLVVTPDISDLLSAFMVSTFMTKVHAGLQNMKARWQRASPPAAITTQNIPAGLYEVH